MALLSLQRYRFKKMSESCLNTVFTKMTGLSVGRAVILILLNKTPKKSKNFAKSPTLNCYALKDGIWFF